MSATCVKPKGNTESGVVAAWNHKGIDRYIQFSRADRHTCGKDNVGFESYLTSIVKLKSRFSCG